MLTKSSNAINELNNAFDLPEKVNSTCYSEKSQSVTKLLDDNSPISDHSVALYLFT